MNRKPPTCEGCPAASLGKGYVPPEGNPSAKVALVGQGPGETEAWSGRPFSGPSGRLLDDWIARAGKPRSWFWIDNIVRCWLPKNRQPTAAEARHCLRVHAGPDLGRLPNLKVTVPIGAPASQYLIGPKVTEAAIGATIPWENPYAETAADGAIPPGRPGHPGRDRVHCPDEPPPRLDQGGRG